MKKNEQQEVWISILSGILAGVLFLLLLFVAQWNFFIDVVMAVGVYLGLFFLLKPVRRIGNLWVTQIPDGDDLVKRLDEAKEDFESMEEAIRNIGDVQVKQLAKQLNLVASDIIEHLERHPEKIKLARQFIDYYQDTAASILNQYVELQDTNLDTCDVQRLKEATSSALETLHKAFQQQFQKLIRNEMMDMDAEIQLLKQTMRMENIEK